MPAAAPPAGPAASYIGIDVGRSTCSVALWEPPCGKVRMLASFTHTDPVVPCYVTKDGELAGQAAYRQWRCHAEAGAMRFAPTRFLEGPPDTATIPPCAMDADEAIEVYTALVKVLVDIAVQEHRVPGALYAAVTVRRGFAAVTRAALLRAVRHAGAFARVEAVEESMAAVLAAHSADVPRPCEPLWVNKWVVLVDVGYGATASLVRMEGNAVTTEREESDDGAGGDAMDRLVYTHLTAALEKKKGIPAASLSAVDVVRVLQAARELKEGLVGAPKQTCFVPIGAEKDVELTLSKAMGDMVCAPAVKALKALLQALLAAPGVDLEGISEVVLTGGAAAMPKVQAAVTAVFKPLPWARVIKHPRPAHAAARGASIAAAALLSGAEADVPAGGFEPCVERWQPPPPALVAHVEAATATRPVCDMTPLTREVVRCRTTTVVSSARTPADPLLRSPGADDLCMRQVTGSPCTPTLERRVPSSWFMSSHDGPRRHGRRRDAPPKFSLCGSGEPNIRGIRAAGKRRALDEDASSESLSFKPEQSSDSVSGTSISIAGELPPATPPQYPFPLNAPPDAAWATAPRQSVRAAVGQHTAVPVLARNVPATIGVAAAGGEACPVLPRYTAVPPGCTEVTRGVVLWVASQGAGSVTVDVLQGEERRACDNYHLLSVGIHLGGVGDGRAVSLLVEMTYAEDHVLTVNAKVQGAAHIGAVRQITPRVYRASIGKYAAAAADLPRVQQDALSASIRQGLLLDVDDRPLDEEELQHAARRHRLEEKRNRAALAAERERIKAVFEARKREEADEGSAG